MFYRFALTIMLCATAVCFGQEHTIDFEEFQKEPSDHRAAVMHIAFGDVKLLSHMYSEALEEFEHSLTILKNSPEVEPFIEFFVRFGWLIEHSRS